MPTGSANSDSSVDQVTTAATGSVKKTLVIRSFSANVQNETFSVAIGHFVSDESNNTGAFE